MDPFFMLLSPRLTWPTFKVARGLSPPISLLPVCFAYDFVIFFVDGKEVLLTHGYLKKPNAMTLSLNQGHVILPMLGFTCVTHSLSLIVVSGTI